MASSQIGIKRVRWSDDEARTIAKKMKQLHHSNPDWNKLELLDVAQEVLPENRRRTLYGWIDGGPSITKALEELGIDFSHLVGGSRAKLTVSQVQPAEEPAPKPQAKKPAKPERQTAMGAALKKAKVKVVEEEPEPAPKPAVKAAPQVEYKQPKPAPQVVPAEIERTAQRMIETFGEQPPLPLQDAVFQLARSVAATFASEVAREVGVMCAKQAALAVREAIRGEMKDLSGKITKAMERPYDTLSQPEPPKTPEAVAVLREEVKAPQQVIIQAASALPADMDQVKLAPKDRKPRVVVLGLMRQQESEILREFGDDMDFTWVRAAHNGGTGELLPERIRESDVVIGMKFVSPENAAVAKKLGVPWVKIHGNFSALKRWLQQWYNGEIALAGKTESHEHMAA